MGDPVAYDQAFKATVAILESLRPPGDPNPQRQVKFEEPGPKIDVNALIQNIGVLFAQGALNDVANADIKQPGPDEPLTEKQKTDSRIADRLGPLLHNIRKEDDK